MAAMMTGPRKQANESKRLQATQGAHQDPKERQPRRIATMAGWTKWSPTVATAAPNANRPTPAVHSPSSTTADPQDEGLGDVRV